MSDLIPSNPDGPGPRRKKVRPATADKTGSNDQRKRRTKSDRAKQQDNASDEDCLNALSKMPGLIAMGVLTTAQANSIRGVYSTILSHNQKTKSARSAQTLDNDSLLDILRQKPEMMSMHFANDSHVFVRAAYHSADAARGISADLLLVDEFQDVAAGDLPVLQETLSHSRDGRTILTGTPKSIDNHLSTVFSQSTANEWNVPCPKCERTVILDERCLGAEGAICSKCELPLNPTQGCWVPRNPTSVWGDGFCINHLMVPWLNYDEILERQRVYDPARFKNEVLGLPSALGDHIVTRAEMEACCEDAPMAQDHSQVPFEGQRKLVAGIDWGGGGVSRTVVVIGFMRHDYVFQICHIAHFPGREEPDRILTEVAERCSRFQVCSIAADGGGNGHVYNRLLLDRLGWQLPLYAILYSAADHGPFRDGALTKWTVNRSATIGGVFSRIKKKMIVLPRLPDVGNYLDEFACEVAEYDDQQRSIKYTHPETQQDDTLHATNYGLLLATRMHNAQLQY